MSSFKRRSTKQSSIPSGARVLPGSTNNLIVSTGIPSLDDILGGGLPLSCSQLILAPDVHSAYGELVQKYFVAQGLATGQSVCVVNEKARDFVEGCMWLPGANAHVGTTVANGPSGSAADEEEDENAQKHDAKIKIAWRYEQMKQFQTTVSSSNQYVVSSISAYEQLFMLISLLDRSSDDFCRVFDLTSRLPATTIDGAISAKQFTIFDIPISDSAKAASRSVLKQLSQFLLTYREGQEEVLTPLRICIPALGSPVWGDIEPQVRFTK